MVDLLIRGIDSRTSFDLERVAVADDTTAEAVAPSILHDHFQAERVAIVERCNALATAIGPQSGPSIVEMLRADRARGDLP